ncbi:MULTISPECIES: RnfH family protein [Novilysobacter]|uniref:RnfH family protein n=1 Tax=Novilysobacter TaxID=3382699 RepID=UPI002FC9CED1
MTGPMRIEVIRAWPQRSESVTLSLPEGSSVADAVAAAGLAGDAGITAYAVHGQRTDPAARLRDGDRVELLRPLQADPKDARRRRARLQDSKHR